MTYKVYGCLDAYNKIVDHVSDLKVKLNHLKKLGNEYVIYLAKIDAPNDSDIMKQVIGRGGCYFIRTTQECNLDFIWHDRETNKIEFWGPYNNLAHGINIIQHRITKITKAQFETKCLDQVATKINLKTQDIENMA